MAPIGDYDEEKPAKLEVALTNERHKTHGSWEPQSACATSLKTVIHQGNWAKLLPYQKEALDMIAVKISRILNGDPNHADHWDDIAGYAHLGKGGHRG